MRKHLLYPCLAIFPVLMFLIFPAPPLSRAAGVWYVAPFGNDLNDCLSKSTPCASIKGALDRAVSGDLIKVAVGTYGGAADWVVTIDKDIDLSGGWNSGFTKKVGHSVIDGEHTRGGVFIISDTVVTIDHFVIQNGKRDDSGGAGINNEGVLTLTYSVVQNNEGGPYCGGGGIANYYQELTINWSTIRDNFCSYLGQGGGIFNKSAQLTINNSTISGNRSASGGGIYNTGNVIINNSTISGNEVQFGSSDSYGGGIFNFSSVLDIHNTTITGNEGAQSGGGIYFNTTYGGSRKLENSIVAGNSANSGPDCSGTVQSEGYNLIGSISGCNYDSMPGDRIGVDPLLGPLDDNGGPTFTHALLVGSPVIDGGNPNGCRDDQGNLFTTDQRGFTRPLDGNDDGAYICDAGAYEYSPPELIFLPAVIRSGFGSLAIVEDD